MAEYERAQMNEAGLVVAPKQMAKQWRWLGLAVAVVGTVGAAVGMSLPSKRMLPTEHLSRFHDALMSAFDARSLQEAAGLEAHFSCLFQEVGKEEPSAMGVRANISNGGKQLEAPEMELVFNSKPGKSAELVAKFKEIFAGAQEYARAAWGADEAGKMSELCEIEAGDGDKAVIKIRLGMEGPMEQNAEKEMGDAFQEQKPAFSASIRTGRTLTEMYDNIHENMALLPGGFSGHIESSFATTVFKAVSDLMNGAEGGPGDHGGPGGPGQDSTVGEEIAAGRRLHGSGPGPEGPGGPFNPLSMLSALAKVTERTEIRYKEVAELDDAFGMLPTFEEVLRKAELMVRHMVPVSILRPLHGLETLADGIDTFTIRGLPQKFQIVAQFENFHVTPVLTKLIGDLKGAAGEPADAVEE